MDQSNSASGPVRSNSVSPQSLRSKPYARPPASQGGRGLLGTLRKGISWIAGSSSAAHDAERAQDEEGAPLNSTPALARSKTSSSLSGRARVPNSEPQYRYASPGAPASISARSNSPRNEGRRRTAHSTLDLSASRGSMSTSHSLSALPNVNGAAIFGMAGDQDAYHPSSAFLRSNSPFAAAGGPSMGDLRLRSPSPGTPARAGQSLYPYTSSSVGRRRGPSPLNPALGATGSERSFTSGTLPQQQRVGWSPARGYTNGALGSQAGSSVFGGSRREEVFGRGSDDIPRIPANEAERILDVLESMRGPQQNGRQRHSTRQLQVPVAVPSPNYGDLGYNSSGRSVFISPYARRQQQEQEERQEQRRRTLSEALRARDRQDQISARGDRTRSGTQAELSPPPEARRKRVQKTRSTQNGDESFATESDAQRPRQRKVKAKQKQRVEEPKPDSDAMDEDAGPSAPAKSINGESSAAGHLLSPRQDAEAATRSPSPARLPSRFKSPAPAPRDAAPRGSRASSSSSMRPGRTHSSRPHQSAARATTTFTPDDDDDPPTDEAALRQAVMPKFSFPANFSFGGASTPAADVPKSVAPVSSAAPSLSALPPLPGLDSSKMPKSKPPVETEANGTKVNGDVFSSSTAPVQPPKPFSFAAPSEKPADTKDAAPASNPFAAFQGKSDAPAASAAPAANPFAAFQGFAAVKPAEKKAETPAFSFVPASKAEEPASKPAESAFSFAPAAAKPAAAPEADTSMTADDEKPAEAPQAGFSFGSFPTPATSAPTTSAAAATAPFAFSAPSTSTPLFGSAPAASSSTPAPTFSFGAAKTDAAPPAPATFAFGPPKTEVSATSSAAPAPAFGFPAPAATSSAGATPTSEAGKSAPFEFKPVATSAPAIGAFGFKAAETPAATSTPAFSFGQPASQPIAPAPFSFTKPAASAAMEQSTSNVSATSFGSAPSVNAAFGSTSSAPSNLFAPAAAATSPFGTAATPSASSAPASNPFAAFQGGSTPAATPSAAFGSQPAASGFSFGQAAPPAATPAFGQAAPPATPAAFGGFGAQANSGGAAFGSQPAAQPQAFGGFGSGSTTPSGPTPGFQFGQPAGAPAFGSQPAQPGPAFGQPSPAAAGGMSFNFGPTTAPDPNAPSGGGGMFSMGSGGNEAPSPSGRRIARMPNRRRAN